MDIIKSLPVASLLSPGLADDLEVFFPEWLSTLLPFYNEARNGGILSEYMTFAGPDIITVTDTIRCFPSTAGTDSSDLTGRRCSGRVMVMNHPSMTRSACWTMYRGWTTREPPTMP